MTSCVLKAWFLGMSRSLPGDGERKRRILSNLLAFNFKLNKPLPCYIIPSFLLLFPLNVLEINHPHA